jgi:hypothetical protein
MQQPIQSSIATSTDINPYEPVSILHELDLGQHSLLLMSDGSISLLAHDEEQAPSLIGNRLSLNSDETYRLFISLHEQFKAQQRPDEPKATAKPAPLTLYEPTDPLEVLRARIVSETPWIMPLARVFSPSQPLLVVKDTRFGNLCTAFSSEVDYDCYCSLFHHQREGGQHG